MNKVIAEDAAEVASSPIKWEKLDHKTIFITGATGFIGSAVIRGIMHRNIHMKGDIRLIGMVRNLEKAKTLFEDFFEDDRLSFVVGNVCKPVECEQDIDFIIHCASNAEPKMYAEDPTGTMQTNFFGTFNMLDLAKRKNARMLYVSTIEIYGAADCATLPENVYGLIDPLNWRSCYNISKKACETSVISHNKQFDTDVVIGRLSYIYGAGLPREDSKVVAVLARAAAEGREMVLKSKGEQIRTYTYISDAVTGLLAALASGKCCEAYNIAASDSVSIAGLGETLEKLYANEGVKLRFDIPEGSSFARIVNNAVMENRKLKSLGWSDRVTVEEGLKRLVESYR